MRALAFILMTLLGLVAAPAAAQTRHVAMRLVAEAPVTASGGRVALAIEAVPEKGWHAYWKNPGDAGIETSAAWSLPPGWSAGPLRYPVPERLLVAGLMNYVYEKPFALLVDLAAPRELDGAMPVSVKLDYLVCTREICVPESQTLSTTLVVGQRGAETAAAGRFDAWRRALPKPLGSAASYQVEGKRIRIGVPFPADAAAGEGWFYPLAAGAIDMAAPQTVGREGDRLVIETAAAATPPTGRIEGVLAVGGQGFEIAATPGTVPAVSGGGEAAAGGWATTAVLAFLGALVGGVILNVMPCVFPILSLKALSLARSGADERAARAEALAYTGGVVAVCLGLGGAILALRAGGSAVGWAFQLQDPRMILVLLLLSVAIALNLAGLFEVPMPRFAGEGGAGGAFATGALAAFVATPCTGPFMGAALGAALVLPTAAALAVFAGLGIGLALPFLLIGFVPALRRRLPRPGAWMERFRRILSVPMWLTAIALAWVLGRSTGVEGMTVALLGAFGIACALWLAGGRQHRGKSFGVVPIVLVLLFAGGTAQAVHVVDFSMERTAAQTTGLGAEAFSEARLAALRAEGRPVFAYFTADWCLTCKVNEKAAIETDATRAAFKAGNVAVMVGDWTDGDPALGRFIEAHNRAGVPLYLFYPPGGEARVLPQLLTPGMLADLTGAGATR